MSDKNIEKNGVNLERLRKLIDTKTREEIARRLECDTSLVTKHYNGKREVTAEYVVKYAKYFGVSADYLLGIAEHKTPMDTVEGESIRAIEDYTGLSEDSIEKLHKLVEFRDQKQNAFPWLEDFFWDNKRWAGETLQIISYIICDDAFEESVGNIVGYKDDLEKRIDSIYNLIKKIEKKKKLDSALISEIYNLSDISHNRNIRLNYYEMIESFKLAIEGYFENLTQKHNNVENTLDKYQAEARICKHIENISDNQAEQIRKEIMAASSVTIEMMNELSKKIGDFNANDNEAE